MLHTEAGYNSNPEPLEYKDERDFPLADVTEIDVAFRSDPSDPRGISFAYPDDGFGNLPLFIKLVQADADSDIEIEGIYFDETLTKPLCGEAYAAAEKHVLQDHMKLLKNYFEECATTDWDMWRA